MFFITRNKLVAALIGCSILAISPHRATAQILEEIQVQPDNFENVVRLQFSARIQFLRAVNVGNTNTVVVYFRILQGEEPTELKTVETLSSRPFDRLPEVAATLAPQTSQVKKLTLQIGKDKQLAGGRVLAGTDGRSVDIVFGDAARKYQRTPDDKRYALTLMSSTSRDDVSGKVIPRELQDYDVFTSQQMRDGQAVYELNLGYFATPEQAGQVRAGLLKQFPQTEVSDLRERRQAMLKAASASAKSEAARGPEQAPAPLPDVEK